jgi:hypothetical protein
MWWCGFGMLMGYDFYEGVDFMGLEVWRVDC